MPTISVTELIRQSFDKLHFECKFKNIYIPKNLEELLNIAEEECISHALSEYTTEMESLREDFFEEGYNEGYEVGYDDGYEAAKQEDE